MRKTVGIISTLALSIAACAEGSPPSTRPSPSRSPLTSPISTPDGSKARIGNEPGELIVADGAVWVTSVQTLMKIDPLTMRILSRVDISRINGALIGGGRAIASADGEIWVTCACSVDDDPEYPNGITGGIAVIGRASNRVRSRVFTDRWPNAIDFAFGGVWVATDKGVTRLDQESLRTAAAIDLNGNVQALSAQGDSIWAAIYDEGKGSSVVRIDAASGHVGRQLPVTQSDGPVHLASTADSVWALVDDLLYRVDPTTNEIAETFRLPYPGSGLTVGAGSLWAWAFHEGVLMRIDANDVRLVSTLDVGPFPADVFVTHDTIWVTNFVDGTLRKIPV